MFELNEINFNLVKKYITKFFSSVSQKDKSLINSASLFFRGQSFEFNNELQLAAKDYSKLLKMDFRFWNKLDENYLDLENNKLSFLRGQYHYELCIACQAFCLCHHWLLMMLNKQTTTMS